MKNIMVIAAHPDDEILGCGGTLYKYSKKSKINLVFLSDGETSRKNSTKKKIKNRKKCAIKVGRLLGASNIMFGDFSDNRLDTMPRIEIIQFIEKCIKKIKPDTILTHHYNDLNIDHQVVSNSVITACRPLKSSSVNLILFFEVLSSTEWQINDSKNLFNPNWFEDITKEINFKLKLLKFYKDELRTYPHSRSIKGVNALAKYRGVSSGYKFAEGFVLGRKK
jgi:LmbE family N-acetylglucosaminyl deacetylase